ncbi:MAG: AmmeMemoRadiSam system radical SAM enzyme [Lachnospiraceae bacterium]|nr:AmmeMemoRadiSam system radical SAM enzyme [Lachnospiraceae bacterium]
MSRVIDEAVCPVCFHHCTLKEGQVGICRARKNIEGRIMDINYGVLTALALDPIEKKPLRMFCPGARILSVGSFGCNLSCPFCQNASISQADEKTVDTEFVSPEKLVRIALSLKKRGNVGIAFTYNEPMVGWEYVRDAARLARSEGLKTVLVTNGTAEIPILEQVLRYIDAMNVDLKAFTEDYYKMCGGSLEETKDFIERSAQKCHVEVTTLIVPGYNDSDEEMDHLSDWLSWISYGLPLHVTRYYPRYRFDAPATPVETIYHLAEVARKNLRNVFVGNC